MNATTKDMLVYAGSAFTGGLLAKSFGMKLLGIATGGAAGVAFAAWTILNRTKVSGETEAQHF